METGGLMAGKTNGKQRKPPPKPADRSQLLFKRGNETLLTYMLKWAAWEWLHTVAKCRAIAFEVRLEGPNGRIADVVGLGRENRVYLIEVKASRSDKSRDDNTDADRSKLKKTEPIMEEAVTLTGGILEAAATYAQRDAEDDWRSDRGYKQALKDHAETVRKRERVSERLATFSTKFHAPAYLRCAHYHYLMVPSGLIKVGETPPMWGLLDERMNVRVEAPFKQVRESTRHVLRAIANANSRDVMKAYGVKRGPGGPAYPGWDQPGQS